VGDSDPTDSIDQINLTYNGIFGGLGHIIYILMYIFFTILVNNQFILWFYFGNCCTGFNYCQHGIQFYLFYFDIVLMKKKLVLFIGFFTAKLLHFICLNGFKNI